MSFTDPSSTISAIAAGAQLVEVMAITTIMPYYLVGAPDVKNVADLKGKRVGSSGLGLSASRLALLVAFGTLGLDPNRDKITLVAAGYLTTRTHWSRSTRPQHAPDACAEPDADLHIDSAGRRSIHRRDGNRPGISQQDFGATGLNISCGSPHCQDPLGTGCPGDIKEIPGDHGRRSRKGHEIAAPRERLCAATLLTTPP